MAPSVKAIVAKLRATVEETYSDDQKNDESKLTVKYVRTKVESELGLEEGFFVTEEWKEKSKTLIKEHAVSHRCNAIEQLADGFLLDQVDGRRRRRTTCVAID